LKKCEFRKCDIKLFEWNYDSHNKECIFGPAKCFYCEKEMECAAYKEHLKDECINYWIEKSRGETGCSLAMMEVVELRQPEGRIKLNLKEISASFVIILNEMIILFRREEEQWSIGVISSIPQKEILQIKYSVKALEKFKEKVIITIKPNETLKELNIEQEYCTISKNIGEIEVSKTSFEKKKETVVEEDSLEGLLQGFWGHDIE
jgi:hypothetical protein